MVAAGRQALWPREKHCQILLVLAGLIMQSVVVAIC